MTFTSLSFLPFILAVFILTYAVKPGQRWMVLLAASVGFYTSFQAPYLLFALFFSIISTYLIGIRLQNSPEKSRNLIFFAGVVLNLLVLLGFRFFPLAYQGTTNLLNTYFPSIKLGALPALLSLGISFYVFQAISYLADIYLEVIEPETHLGRFALFMSFFPKLLQGPIERAENFLPQIAQPGAFDIVQAQDGMRRFAWGFFKKVVIADRLALLVTPVFNNIQQFSGLALILTVYGYALQLYFDFSGYTDMALGIAKIFNLQLAENFKQPYLAHTVSEFWKRWHISFSSWILDYIYKPLQLTWRAIGRWGVAAALVITFLLSGLWHGATWGFLAWGFLHGLYMTAEYFYMPVRRKLYRKLRIENSVWVRVWQIFLTFNLVSFAWIFFRANTFSDAIYMAQHLFSGVQFFECAKITLKTGLYQPIFRGVWAPEQIRTGLSQVCLGTLQNFQIFPGKFSLENGIILLVSMLILLISTLAGARLVIAKWPGWLRWLGYLVFALWLLFSIWMIEASGQGFQEFLYFRF